MDVNESLNEKWLTMNRFTNSSTLLNKLVDFVRWFAVGCFLFRKKIQSKSRFIPFFFVHLHHKESVIEKK